MENKLQVTRFGLEPWATSEYKHFLFGRPLSYIHTIPGTAYCTACLDLDEEAVALRCQLGRHLLSTPGLTMMKIYLTQLRSMYSADRGVTRGSSKYLYVTIGRWQTI
jgi:hypothetical protein